MRECPNRAASVTSFRSPSGIAREADRHTAPQRVARLDRGLVVEEGVAVDPVRRGARQRAAEDEQVDGAIPGLRTHVVVGARSDGSVTNGGPPYSAASFPAAE